MLLQKDAKKRLGHFEGGQVDVKAHPYFKEIEFVHILYLLKTFRLPKSSLVKPADYDKYKIFPNIFAEEHPGEFKDW